MDHSGYRSRDARSAATARGRAERERRSCPERLWRRLGSQSGASLAEMLAVLLIISLISLSLGGGIPAVQKAYFSVVRRANAEMLASTTVMLMRDELSYAEALDSDTASAGTSGGAGSTGSGNLLFKSGNYGLRASFENAIDPGKGIELCLYSGTEADLSDVGVQRIPLVPESYGLYTGFSGYSFKEGLFTVSGLSVYDRDEPGKAILTLAEFSVRTVN